MSSGAVCSSRLPRTVHCSRPREIPPSSGAEIDLVYAGQPYRLRVFAIGGWTYRVHSGKRVAQV